MPATPIFQQVDSLALYALDSSSQSGLPGYWAGYLPSTHAAFGATATLDQAWQDAGGLYLFLNATPSSLPSFLAALQAYLPEISPTGAVRFLWVANPNDSSSAWQTQVLLALASGSPIVWTVPRQALFALGSYGIQIAPGTVLAEADPSTLGYGIAIVPGFVFFAPAGAWTTDVSTAWLPLAGIAVGALCGAITIPTSGGDGFAALAVQLRYAAPASSDPSSNEVRTLAMPVLQQAGANLRLFASFDPLNPLAFARTQLAFFAAGSTNTLPAYPSTLTMTLGYGITLQPLNASAPLWPARLVFGASPFFLVRGQQNPYLDYYLAPDGSFQLTQAINTSANISPAGGRFPLGVSGLEYVVLPTAGSAITLFACGQPAFAPGATPDDKIRARLDEPLLTPLATTSYLNLLPVTAGQPGLTYCAQPKQAPLYVAGQDLGVGFMDFHEMQAAILASYTGTSPAPATFPVGIYGGIDPKGIAFARTLEQAALAPARRLAIGLPTIETPVVVADAPPPSLAVTPQGLVAILSQDQTQWAGLLIANVDGSPQLSFAPVGAAFEAALQSNELFFVVSNVDVLMSATSVAYQLTPDNLPLLQAAGVPEATVDALRNLLNQPPNPFPVFPTEAAFVAAISPVAGAYLNLILPIAGLLRISLSGWTFQLSPRAWRSGGPNWTIMLFKFCNRSLEQMVADGAAWGWQAAARDQSHGITPTQEEIQRIFAAAAAAAAESPLSSFYHEVVADPVWNGVLFLNAPVNPQTLPDELKFVAAGIDASRFYAHHVGFAVTPFEVSGNSIVLHQTASFGLIDYNDLADQFFETTIPFAFKTLRLEARFVNSALAGFTAEAELMLNRLFGAELNIQQPEHGNNLRLLGGYQMQNNAPAYAFALEGTNVFDCARSALASIEVLGVQIQTSASDRVSGGLTVDFILSGNFRFFEFPLFDLFSYGPEYEFPETQAQPLDGYLRFGGLPVRMTFSLAAPEEKTFTVSENRVSFDLSNSKARPLSLAQNFPVQLTSFVASPEVDGTQGQRPEDLGFTSISAPINQALLSPPWYGLVMTLDLGTLGALAGSAGISIRLLAAWSPGVAENQRPLFLGLQLPDAKSLGMTLPIQGVMRLGFRSFQFQTSGDETKRTYMLRLRRLALTILGWSFPPGNTDVFLFGNNKGDPKTALGWYAAYAAPDEKKTSAAPTLSPRERRLLSGRRG